MSNTEHQPITFEDISNYLKDRLDTRFPTRNAVRCVVASFLSHRYQREVSSGIYTFSLMKVDKDGWDRIEFSKLNAPWITQYVTDLDNDAVSSVTNGHTVSGEHALRVLERIKKEYEERTKGGSEWY